MIWTWPVPYILKKLKFEYIELDKLKVCIKILQSTVWRGKFYPLFKKIFW